LRIARASLTDRMWNATMAGHGAAHAMAGMPGMPGHQH
jgi:hypothetical protein